MFAGLLTFLLSAFIESFISIIQFLLQKSVGFYFLGESIINPNVLGVSKINFLESQFIRSYGTLPHPNILACFLFCAIIVNLFLLISLKCSTWNILNKNLPNCLKSTIRILVIITPFFLYFSLFLTFSRMFIFLGVLFLMLTVFYYKKYIFRFAPLIIFNIIISIIFLPLLVLRLPENQTLTNSSLPLRTFYNSESLIYIKNNYFWGIGSGNFVYHLKENNPHLKPWDLQPVHNIYLLAISEQGIILFSIIFFTFILLLQKHKEKKIFFIGIILLLISGLSDHLLYSFPQGSLSSLLLFAVFISNIDLNENVPRGTFSFK